VDRLTAFGLFAVAALTYQKILLYSSSMRSASPATTFSLSERATLFHALSDETRLAVLELLRGGERCVCELQDVLDAAQSRLSFHLKVLRDAGLVRDRKEGRWSYYSLNPAGLEAVSEFALALREPRAGTAPARAAAPLLHQLTRARRRMAPTTKAS
jgi:ArsR family transcriptional regulator